MRICIDIDDTITYAPDLFAFLTGAIDAEIVIVTFRTDRASAIETLSESGIRWDHLILSNCESEGKQAEESLADWKARIVNQLQPAWFFEDMPEVVCRIDESIKVFMPCDEVIRDWLTSNTN